MTRRPRARRVRRGERGFTLVELLVALLLLSMISLMVVGGIRFGSRTWERTVGASEGLNAVVDSQRFLRARLSEAESRVGGDAGFLWFESPWMTSLGAGAIYRFELDLTEEGALLLSWAPAGEEDPPPELVGDRALLTEVEALEISFFGVGDGSEEAVWRSDWDFAELRPSLVRIDVTPRDRRISWPPLIVALAD